MLPAVAVPAVSVQARGARLLSARFAHCLLALLALLLLSSVAAHATNPTVPQGGSASFAKTGTGNYPGSGNGSWDIYQGGTLRGCANTTNGWSVTYNSGTSQFTVTAPGNNTYAPIATNYTVRLVYGMGSAVSATFDVVAGSQAVSSLSLSPTSVIGAGGTPVTGTVTLSLSASGNTSVLLSSDTPSAATVPTSVTVLSGQTSATFTVTTYAVTTSTTVTITASYNGTSKTATLTVAPAPIVTSVTFPPGGSTTSPIGGTSFTGKVTLNIAAASAISVTLQSTNSAVSVPATVSVAAGASSATFTVTTTAVATATTAYVIATYNGTSPQGTVIVQPPQLQVPGGLTLSPTTTAGGNNVTATITLTGIAPSTGLTPVDGYPIYLTCSLANTVSYQNTPVPTSGSSMKVVVLTGSSSVTITLATSTVNYTTQLTLTATDGTNPNTWIQQSVGLTLVASHLWVSDIILPHTLLVNWDVSATGPSFVLKRQSTNGTQAFTVANSVKTYNDNFGSGSFMNDPATTYTYTLWDTYSSGPNQGQASTLLCTEVVSPYAIAAQAGQTQAVDSRLDLRYSTNVFLNHNFGATSYRGGLFAGYASDPAKVGRSFARFNLSVVSSALSGSGLTFRNGTVDAYFTGAIGSATIGCQPVSNTFWDPVNNVSTSTPWDSTMVWNTAPQVNPANAVTTMSVSGTTPGWIAWPMTQQIYSALQGSSSFPVGWTSTTEASSGWAYFAKPEYDANYPPTAACLLETPIPIQILFNPTSPYGGGNVTCTIVVNGIGPNDSVPVTVTATPSSTTTLTGFTSPSTINVTGLGRSFTFTVQTPPATQMGTPPNQTTIPGPGGSVTVTATANGTTVTATLSIRGYGT